MDNKNAATQKLGVMPQQMVATRPGNRQSIGEGPRRPRVCITGFAGEGSAV